MADQKISDFSAPTAGLLADYLEIVQAGANKKIQALNLLGLLPVAPGGRLTLTTGVPVTTSDVTAATDVFYTPYLHNGIQLWDSNQWQVVAFSQKTLALGTLTSARPYDVFGFLSGGDLSLESLSWTNDTSRATAVTYQDGRLCKSGDKTRLYLGTFRTTSTTTTEDSGGGTTTQVGGKRFLWNMYNRRPRSLVVKDTTNSWSYGTDTWRVANGATAPTNSVEYICGILEDEVTAEVKANIFLQSNTGTAAKCGVGVDSSTPGMLQGIAFDNSASGTDVAMTGGYRGYPGLGYHYLAWCEKGAGGTQSTFLGDNGADGSQSGLFATVWG